MSVDLPLLIRTADRPRLADRGGISDDRWEGTRSRKGGFGRPSKIIGRGHMRTATAGWREFLGKVFKDRQILIRSENGVTYLHFRRRHQYLLAGLVSCGFIWAMATTVAYGLASMLIDEQSGHIQDLEIGYAELITDLADRYGTVEAAAAELGHTSALGEQILDRNTQLQAEISALQTSLGASENARSVIERARESLIGRIMDLELELEEAVDERGALTADISALNEELASLTDVRDGLLQDQSGLRHEIGRLTHMIDEASDWNATLEDQIQDLTMAVQGAYRTVDRIVEERDTLIARIAELERGLARSDERGDQLASLLYDAQRTATEVSAERDLMNDQTAVVRSEVVRLTDELTTLRQSQAFLFAELRERSESHVVDLETGLALTGLDIDQMITALHDDVGFVEEDFVIDDGMEHGTGGPMIPMLPDHLLADRVWSDAVDLVSVVGRAADLRDVANRLPIGIPLRDAYRLSSGFGTRRDPFTGRLSQHWGLDFSAPLRTPIYATAPGTVTFAGRRGAYGNMVEIDHGLGLVTRYAHLNSIGVSEGDRVEYGARVGLMGSTGRSTGSHLHYEVHVNGEERNPINFLTAGQHVFEISDQ